MVAHYNGNLSPEYHHFRVIKKYISFKLDIKAEHKAEHKTPKKPKGQELLFDNNQQPEVQMPATSRGRWRDRCARAGNGVETTLDPVRRF